MTTTELRDATVVEETPDGGGDAASLDEGEASASSLPAVRRSVGLALLTIGLCLLLFFAYLFWFTALQQQREQRQLLNVFTTPAGAVPLSGALPADGQPTAILTINSIGLQQVVVQGTTPTDLTSGPGTLTNAARLGTKGNAVIIGRRYTAGATFGKLNQLVAGDKIVVTTGLGLFHYRVIQPTRVSVPGDLSPASPIKRAQLTLITASSMTGGGTESVVARLTSAPASAKRVKIPPSAEALGTAGSSAAIPATILWGAILALTFAASFVAYTRARKYVVVVYVLSTPIVLASALMFYSHLYLLLPSTI